uniref:Uncharacterized protein n=1 Tax=Kalanchoe fedtschenkoi TaxID=63787 RepID=A0A7N0UNC5_KALFE
MLSSAGLSGGASVTAKPKALSLAPPPSGGVKLRSPLPPPPNDPVATRLTSPNRVAGLKGSKENVKSANDSLSDLSQLEKNLPSSAGSSSARGTASGWAAF